MTHPTLNVPPYRGTQLCRPGRQPPLAHGDWQVHRVTGLIHQHNALNQSRNARRDAQGSASRRGLTSRSAE